MIGDFTILLAEDDENDVILVQRALKLADINNPVQVVRDGEEAIAYLRGDNQYAHRELYPLPKLLLLDIKMPKKNGLEVLEWIREKSPDGLRMLPVIVMSSSNIQTDIDRAYLLGVNAYLVKPTAFNDLVVCFRKTTEFWKETAALPWV
jgi:CheY-like chemotaxis protein